MSAKDNKRDLFVDAVKGIGIISIVIGHASWDIPFGGHVIHAGPFVYLYHLAVFAFCTGYLFKPDIPDIWSYIGKKAKGLVLAEISITVSKYIRRCLLLCYIFK